MITMKRIGKTEKVDKTLTPRRYAEKHGVAYTTVMKWLQKGLVEGAQKEPLPPPFEGHVYQIPEDAQPPDLKPGPKPKAQAEEQRTTTKKTRKTAKK